MDARLRTSTSGYSNPFLPAKASFDSGKDLIEREGIGRLVESCAPPEISYFETRVIVDNTLGKTILGAAENRDRLVKPWFEAFFARSHDQKSCLCIRCNVGPSPRRASPLGRSSRTVLRGGATFTYDRPATPLSVQTCDAGNFPIEDARGVRLWSDSYWVSIGHQTMERLLSVSRKAPPRAKKSLDIDVMVDNAREASELLKALAHESRLIILCLLIESEKTVRELEDLLKLRQPAVSQQLARLRADNLVEARREGKNLYYAIARPEVIEIVGSLHRTFCAR